MNCAGTAERYAFQDVSSYGPEHLTVHDGEVRVPVTYRREWQDGFGARGWKLDATIGDPEIIASTRETGARIPTSVFVHDVFDHLLCGFAVSGHRAEAMALRQLAARTGTDIRPDYAQMVREDLRAGRLVGEGDCLDAFAGDGLSSLVDVPSGDDRGLALALREAMGETGFEEAFVERFFELGRAGDAHARKTWRELGFDWCRRAPMAAALQRAFATLDVCVEKLDVEEGTGVVSLREDRARIDLEGGEVRHRVESAVDASALSQA